MEPNGFPKKQRYYLLQGCKAHAKSKMLCNNMADLKS